MTDLDKVLEAVTRNAEAAARLQIAADRLTLGTTNGGNVTLSVNAGGVGVWVAVTCCVAQFILTLALAGVVLWIAMNDRDKGHQMNALYMSVPGLRDLVDKQMRLNEQTQRGTAKDQTR